MRISLELVPRDSEGLKAELQLIKTEFPAINTINIPDLTRFDLRSWEASRLSKSYYRDCIPHIRAMDFDAGRPFDLIEYLDKHHISEVLIVTGDEPQNSTKQVYPTTCIDMVTKLKREHPHLKIYSAIDPYRTSIRKEYEYVQQKLDAGVDGFFSQPFFDLRLMELYADILEGTDIFWGVSPVVSETSKRYWEKRNHVVFPKNFEPTLDWNIAFSKEALAYTQETNSSLYFMPIKVDLQDYFNGIFGEVLVKNA
ncbi:methylenetetrahydrofolate reductase (NADPH) [Paenibacillus endophyticus]|uniref:Methylenetetrahydrofolate reductase n=1 Tax=Paenibacillus endophyticus TaxID=1294268 RepID=A0A7W5C9E2_9BACL|nr:methylenetetrahydrofolate reductase [Paenibacillus endophyticus]MBB3153571.1 methylenetetrahydrofolate reductase (NADPH) [Paenibacillus endophyticus]